MRASYFLSALVSTALVVLAQDSANASSMNVTQTIVDNAAAGTRVCSVPCDHVS
jgi:hypothetical protein